MSAYGAIKRDVEGAPELTTGEVEAPATPMKSRALMAVAVTAGVALTATAGLAFTAGSTQATPTDVVTAGETDLRMGGKNANNGWSGKAGYNVEGHEQLDWLNRENPRADQVQSLRNLVEGNSNLDFMGAAVTYSGLDSMEGYAGNHSYMYNLLSASNECKWSYLYDTDYEECDYIMNYALENDIQVIIGRRAACGARGERGVREPWCV